jgi:hypothetical protein
MKDLTEHPCEPATPRLSRRTLLSALVTLTATPMLAEEVWANPQAAPGAAAIAAVPRRLHTAVLLSSGLVLVTGGVYEGTLADTQLFNPSTGLWYAAAPMNTPRSQHASVLMGDGSVLVMGGFYQGALADVEIYHPASDTWTPAPPMAIPRYDHSAVLLGDGSVLIYGGIYEGILDSPETYKLPIPAGGA